MVKSLRFLVILIALAAFGMIASVQSQAAQAPKDVVFVLAPVQPDNTTCFTKAVYVSKQLLPSTGLAVTSAGVEEDNLTNPDAFDNGNGAGLNKIDGTSNKMVFTFDLTNGTFSNDLVLLLDNGTKTPIVPDYQTANKVQFTVEDANVSGSSYTSLMLVDKSDNYTTTHLGIKVDGSLPSGGKVNLSLTTTWNGAHMYNGCFNKVIYVVEDQWTAQLCCCKNSLPDTDYLVADANGVTVQDSETGIKGFSLYNKCSNYHNITIKTGCCTHVSSPCGLFCNQTTTTGSTTSGVSCSMPGTCETPDYCTQDGKGLKIVENRDFYLYPSYKVNSLANTNVTFTLTGNLKNIASITLVSSNDGNPGSFVQPAVLGTFSIDYTNNKATVTIPGTTLFVKANGGLQVAYNEPIHFKVKITPKSGVALMPNKFSLSAVMEAGTDLTNDQALNWGEIIDWTYNYNASYVFMAPYVRSDSATTSVIRFENASKSPVGVSLYVNDPAGNSWVFIKHITIPAGESTYELGSQFISDAAATAGITLDGTKGFAVYGIANANYRTFTVYGSQQYAGAGFRALPIDIFGMGATGQ